MSVKLPPQVELIRLGTRKAIVLDLIEPRPGHYATDLGFFPERHQVGQNAEMLTAPVAAGDAHPALHFVENEQHFILVADPAERLQPFATEMIVATFTLDRLDNNRGDVETALLHELHDLGFGFFFPLDHVAGRARIPANEKSMNGVETRGQLNLANKSVFTGSVFVRLMV